MTVRLLHYSDVENAYDDPERIGRLAGTIESRRDGDTIVCGTGDTTGPGVLSVATDGRQSLDFFDAVDPALDTFGNHEFDHGLAELREIVAESPQTWVSTNVYRDGERFGSKEGVVPTAIVERGGERVGFFGVLDDATPALNPTAEPLALTDPYRAAEDAVDRLREAGVDHVVALSHLGRGDERLAVEVDVDVILGGHVHSERIERTSGTVLTRPGANGHVLLEVVLDDGDATVTRHAVAEGPLDRDVAGSLRARMAETGLDGAVATVDEPIERTEATVYRGESRIGNFVADAYRWAAEADVGLQNSGGIREGPALAGEVTVGDLLSVVPFDEPVAVAELTGSELRDLLSQASGRTLGFGEEDWWHAHLSGAHVEWDAREEHVVSLAVDGEPVDPGRTYTLATTAYLFYSDHEFPVLTEDKQTRTLDDQYEVLADYARVRGVDPTIEGRILRHGRAGRDEQV